MVEAAAPQGRIALIDDPVEPLDVMALKGKSLSLHWELMFTRSLFNPADMDEQGQLLNRVAELVDQEKIRTTLSQKMSPINAKNLRIAHEKIEQGHTQGKIVLSKFES